MSLDTLETRLSSQGIFGEDIDLFSLLGHLWRGKWIIIVCALLMGTIGAYYVQFIAVPTFSATTTIALENRESQVIDLKSVVSGISENPASVNTEIGVLSSRELLGQVVRKLDLTKDPEFNPTLRPPSLSIKTAIYSTLSLIGLYESKPGEFNPTLAFDLSVSTLASKLSITNERQSYLFRITVETENPQKSADIALAVAQAYVDSQVVVKVEATAKAEEWLSERLIALGDELAKAEIALNLSKSESEFVSEENLQGLSQKLKLARVRLSDGTDIVIENKETFARLNAVRNQSPEAKARAANSDVLDRLLDEGQASGDFRRFEQSYAQLLARAEQNYQSAEARLPGLQLAVQTLNDQVQSQSDEFRILRTLEREVESTRQVFEFFQLRLRETAAQRGLFQPDSRILSEPVLPTSATSPRKVRFTVVALFIGGIIGAMIVILRSLTATGVKSASQMQKDFGLPVWGQIPKVSEKTRDGVFNNVLSHPTGAAAEGFRNLRTAVMMHLNDDMSGHTILISSSTPGEGKSVISVSLAQKYHEIGKRILLIEGDLRRPMITKTLKLTENAGLYGILAGEVSFDDVVGRDDGIGFDVLQAGKGTINAADVFSCEDFNTLLAEAKTKYDYILIDTAPVMVVGDALILARLSDIVLHVTKWNVTSDQVIREAMLQYTTAGAKIDSLVLNQIDMRRQASYGYYGTYGVYGDKYYT